MSDMINDSYLILGTFITSLGILFVNIVFYAKKWNSSGGKE